MSVPFRGLHSKFICAFFLSFFEQALPFLNLEFDTCRTLKERPLKDAELVCVTWLKIQHWAINIKVHMVHTGHRLGFQAKMNFLPMYSLPKSTEALVTFCSLHKHSGCRHFSTSFSSEDSEMPPELYLTQQLTVNPMHFNLCW